MVIYPISSGWGEVVIDNILDRVERRLKRKNMKQIFKKISAIAASALMVGMSMGVATAYPTPFNTVGDVAIVYGVAADASDSTQAGVIQTSLSASLPGGTPGGESLKFETDINKLNVNDTLISVRTTPLRAAQLPTVLASGTYSNAENEDFTYDQKIEVSTALTYAYFIDTDYEDSMPTLGVKITKKDPVLNYTLDFIKPAEDDSTTSDLVDFEESSITFLGKTYDIVDAVNQTAGMKLTLMSGAVTDTLDLYGTGSYTANGKTYDVELTYVDSTDYCKFKIDGVETDKIVKGGIDKLSDGTYVGVADTDWATGATTEIMRCTFYLGADKIVLDDTKEVEINGVDVDKLYVHFGETNGAPFKWDDMVIEWKADDDLFITESSEVVMPGFGSIKLTGGALTTTGNEEITKVRGNSNKGIVLYTTIKSGYISQGLELLGSNTTGGFNHTGGSGNGERLLTRNLSTNLAPSNPSSGGQLGMMYDLGSNATGHQYFVATYLSAATGSSYLIEVSDADDTHGVDFTDVVTGLKIQENIKNNTDFTIGDASFKVSRFAEDHYVEINASNGQTYIDRLVTAEGLIIYLPIGSTNSSVSPYTNLTSSEGSSKTYIIYMEEESKEGTLGSGSDINVTVSFTSSFQAEAKIAVAAKAMFSENDMWVDPDDDNYYTAYAESDCGTKVIYDADPNEETVDIVYYGGQVYGNVYIAEEGATSEGGDIGDVIITDAEVGNFATSNLIIVGGSCINEAAADILGVTYPTCTTAWTTETTIGTGEFLIQSFGASEQSLTSKIALLVAGYAKEDTANAVTYLTTKDPATTAGTKWTGTTAESATLVTTSA